MLQYPWNEKNDTFTWLSLLYNPFKWRLVNETREIALVQAGTQANQLAGLIAQAT